MEDQDLVQDQEAIQKEEKNPKMEIKQLK